MTTRVYSQQNPSEPRSSGPTSPAALLARHRITAADLTRVRELGALLLPHADRLTARFHEELRGDPEYAQHFADGERLRRVANELTGYWRTLFEAQVDDTYVQRRSQVGATHARIGLSLGAYFAGMSVALAVATEELLPEDALGPRRGSAVQALTKLMHLDTAIVVESYAKQSNDRIVGQARALMEMSTPVTMVGDGILMLPVVGLIDSRRAQDIMSSTLTRIAETRSKVFIIDIGGVSVVDTAVANYLIKVARATKLMGCRCLLSGLSPAVAQTVIELGIDVSGIETRATLRDALDDAYRAVGLRLVPLGG